MPVSAGNVATFTQKWYINIESILLVKKYVTFNLCVFARSQMKPHRYTMEAAVSQIHVRCSEGVFAVLWLSKSGIWLLLWSDLFIHMKVESRTLLS